MVRFHRSVGLGLSVLLVLAATAYGGRHQVTEKTFEKKEVVTINTVSGDCIVHRGSSDEILVVVESNYYPGDNFEPRFNERGNVLELEEELYGNTRGGATWDITVPDGTTIEFETASGDFRLQGFETDVDVETASGDITIRDASGQFELNTASGDIELENCKGRIRAGTASGDVELVDCSVDRRSRFSTASGDVRAIHCTGMIELSTASGDAFAEECEGRFSLSAASGDVEVEKCRIEGESSFEVASGDAYVSLAETCKHDLQVSSASGKAVLTYNGNPIEGTVEMVSRVRRGRIVSPFDFDEEEEFYRHREEYVRKIFTRGSESPNILIATASGRAVLEK